MPRKKTRSNREPETGLEIYTDPVDDWIADNSEEWSRKYPGKYLLLLDFQVLDAFDSRTEAFKVAERYADEGVIIWYIPRQDELVTLV